MCQINNILTPLSTFTDICITMFLMDETFPQKWINRRGFVQSRKVLILIWLMFASNLLNWSYKSTLLSTLIPIYYENPINTLEDADNSDLPLLVPRSTVLQRLLATDPRPTAKRIFKKSVLFSFNGTPPAWVSEKYVFSKKFF